ncbi:disintegrin and metalloproteinase domain-containing protein 5-like [Phyllostomus discolor]|uniref:Disintegrin and metalloproteinase domain-containing protein 5-like n=1 Tax=Phyllostomus discolor TaxID=89673 RepID=A0A7E6CJD5_9CHIR|nr:disintegrin and metalloproteinase domain-containing protein 5-like [Phyllostomus discolor]
MPTHLQRQQRALRFLAQALPLWSPALPLRLAHLLALRPCSSCTFTGLNVSTAVIRPAGFQDNGAMFFLLVLLTGLSGLQAGPHPHKIFLQTTVPEKISSSDTKKDPENNVAYMITINEKPYFVYLTKQSFLSSVSVVYSYDQNDTQKANPLLDQMDCSYYGYIAGFPNSVVSLNTCSGLRGTLQFKNVSYGIEPVATESEFVHMIYEDKGYDINLPLLRENDFYSYNTSEFHYGKKSEVHLYWNFPNST